MRRHKEVIGDIDFLVSSRRPAEVIEFFVTQPGVLSVSAKGDTKASVLIRGGFQADLRMVSPEQRGAALQYFTGSKAHNIALRDRALERGWKLNEYGLFDAQDQVIAAGTETQIYEALGLASQRA